eukprot:TRINITY_DN9298_c0_g1_i1.p1 TRINITY_DN9298_c0_g1~~TRINITY_DN9298_c0_g1_i1.p1  ORF type:complete len:307 (-),score=29.59 TRINITY_DN9298_c0_g1_i1:62-982(-)
MGVKTTVFEYSDTAIDPIQALLYNHVISSFVFFSKRQYIPQQRCSKGIQTGPLPAELMLDEKSVSETWGLRLMVDKKRLKSFIDDVSPILPSAFEGPKAIMNRGAYKTFFSLVACQNQTPRTDSFLYLQGVLKGLLSILENRVLAAYLQAFRTENKELLFRRMTLIDTTEEKKPCVNELTKSESSLMQKSNEFPGTPKKRPFVEDSHSDLELKTATSISGSSNPNSIWCGSRTEEKSKKLNTEKFCIRFHPNARSSDSVGTLESQPFGNEHTIVDEEELFLGDLMVEAQLRRTFLYHNPILSLIHI